jgi:hypothetical protein
VCPGGLLANRKARLVERLIAAVPERGEPVVVELGPGTWPATEAIQRKLALILARPCTILLRGAACSRKDTCRGAHGLPQAGGVPAGRRAELAAILPAEL